MKLKRARKLRCGNHFKKRGKAHHALAEGLPRRPPFSMRVLLPKKIFHRNTAQIRPGDPETVDPSAKSALHSRVSDVVIYAHERRVEPIEDLLQIPDGSAHEIDPRVRVIHGAN